MKKLEFRTLKANEIDARVGTVSKTGKGFSLLLYKDSRADMNLLDETVGCMNWKREHTRDNANCIVSIYDEDKKEWISKEDTGTESNTEAKKGLASDSFKRACVNWGIGRELYNSPFIWISSNIADKGDKFKVTNIEYDEEKNVTSLVIVNAKTGEVIYSYGGNVKVSKPTNTPKAQTKAINTPKTSNKDTTEGSGKPTGVCCNCGDKVLPNVSSYSMAKLGKELCFKCQKA